MISAGVPLARVGGMAAGMSPSEQRTYMGDRGNIVVRQSDKQADDVWFYGHWSGYRMESAVREALALRERWTDTSYLARIIFCRFVGSNPESWADTCSFGISTSIGDNEYPILVVDCERQTVYRVEEKDLKDGRLPEAPKKVPKSERNFVDFIAEKEPEPADI